MITDNGNGVTITGGADIALFQLCARIQCVKLEALGLKNSRGSVTAVCKRAYGFTGNRERVLAQLELLRDELKASRTR